MKREEYMVGVQARYSRWRVRRVFQRGNGKCFRRLKVLEILTLT